MQLLIKEKRILRILFEIDFKNTFYKIIKMNVIQINIHKLKISDLNVRKILASDEDETSISDLASDIKTNGLINPITVRNKDNDNYEIIAGQRRFLACKLINMKSISCNVINVADQKAEEISLVENVQRNQMTNMDKIKSYVKLYNLYKKDIKRVTKAISISESTLKRYLELMSLSFFFKTFIISS